jgi:hypothetical protein
VQECAMRFIPVLVLSCLLVVRATADDGAASIAAGGLILMKREPRIVMAKEVLTISPKRVLVDYDFRNDSDQNITTVVAFPVPAYSLADAQEAFFGDAGFDDFELSVQGKPLKFRTEARAFIGKREITSLLAREHINAASFGHTNFKDGYDSPSDDLTHVSAAARNRLIIAGAFDKDGKANWKVVKKYYWTQTFPAHGMVHLRHQYSPVLGGSNTIGNPAVYQGKDATWEYTKSCPTPALRESLSSIWNEYWKKPGDHEGSPLWINYVSFILTTANTWKTPIEDFTLIVERPHDPKYKTYVSFCWDGPVEQIDADHFSAHINGLVPRKELLIGFIHANAK